MADGMLEDTLPEPVLPAKTEVEISDHVVSPEHLVRRDEPTSDDEVVVEWKAGRLRKRE